MKTTPDTPDAALPLAYAGALPADSGDAPAGGSQAGGGRAGGAAVLLFVSFVWGTTFVATKQLVAGDAPALGPGGVTFWRFAVASAALVPFVAAGRRPFPPGVWRAGLELSVWLWAGYATQAIGLQYTTVSRSAFVTALNVVFVPVLTALAGRRERAGVWAAAGLAVAGAGLLSNDGAPPSIGDAWTLGCALMYAAYIVRLERFAARLPAGPLAAVQIWGTAALSLPWAAAEGLADPAAAGGVGWGRWTPGVAAGLLYMGTVATLGTVWLQAVGQRRVPAAAASVLYTTEPVFASAVAMVGFGDRLGPAGWAGAGLILAAAAGSQAVAAWRGEERGKC